LSLLGGQLDDLNSLRIFGFSTNFAGVSETYNTPILAGTLWHCAPQLSNEFSSSKYFAANNAPSDPVQVWEQCTVIDTDAFQIMYKSGFSLPSNPPFHDSLKVKTSRLVARWVVRLEFSAWIVLNYEVATLGRDSRRHIRPLDNLYSLQIKG
jgi:hypothetical protein